MRRRHLLALLGTASLGGCATVPHGPLPDSLTRSRTTHVSVPQVPQPLQSVSDAHIASLRTHVERVASKARDAWARVDRSALDDEFVPYTEQTAERALAFAADLDGKPRTMETVGRGIVHVTDTAHALGYARGVLDEVDPRRDSHRNRGPARGES